MTNRGRIGVQMKAKRRPARFSKKPEAQRVLRKSKSKYKRVEVRYDRDQTTNV